MKKLCTLFLVAVLLAAMIGCSTQQPSSTETGLKEETEQQASSDQKTAEIRFKDILDREIVLKGPAQRVFLGFYTECFLAINGAESLDRVAAMSKAEWSDFFYSQWLAYSEALPRLNEIVDTGSIYKESFSMETAITARPDVAILAPFQYETLGENVKKLEEAGIPVVVVDYNSQTVDKHVASTLIIGKVMGNEARAQQLADEYVAAVEDVKQRVEKFKEPRKRVYFELGNLGPSEYGNSYGDYLWGSLVSMAGGDNIALGKIESYGALSPEYILSSDPEVIFFAGSHWTNDTGNRVLMGFNVSPTDTHTRLKPYMKRPGWNKLSAVKNNQIYAVDHAGMRSIYDYTYLQFIAKALYPSAFEDVDPLANHKAFYEKYLPVEAVGSFMTKMPD